ncbi:MAG: gliding motility-associated C-terminal domain-containing protein, partial [Bacteroidetes bacterium]
MKQRITLAICLLSICWNLQAQKDTEFWFSAPEISSDHGDQPIQLRFSAFDQAASVRVSLPADPTFVPLTVQIPANQTRSIELTNYKEILENKPSNTVHKKGILIEATASIGAYYEVNASNNPERFLLKGANALGRRFYIPSQYGFLNQLGSESFEIVATRDNTKITITTTKPVQGHSANTPFVINLNRGESFSVRAAGTQAYDHLNGSYIESDKPIAVLSSDDSIRTGNGWDLVGDQLVPVELTGTEYIAVRGFANPNAERIYITATEPGTQVYINGNLWPGPALAAGKSLEITLTGPSTFIRATKPVYVFHLSGINDEAGGALLPPLNCTGASQVGFAQGFGMNSLMILTQNGNQAFFVLNGDSTAIDASDFSVVPGTSGEWVAARFEANAFLNGNTN